LEEGIGFNVNCGLSWREEVSDGGQVRGWDAEDWDQGRATGEWVCVRVQMYERLSGLDEVERGCRLQKAVTRVGLHEIGNRLTVASSRTRIFVGVRSARANETSCRCPCDKFDPMAELVSRSAAEQRVKQTSFVDVRLKLTWHLLDVVF
jgi:hypothetical protein